MKSIHSDVGNNLCNLSRITDSTQLKLSQNHVKKIMFRMKKNINVWWYTM